MKRHVIEPRSDWIKQVESFGMIYHHTDGEVYWKESAYYAFSSAEIDALEKATTELWTMALVAAEHVLEEGRFSDLGIPAIAEPLIRKSWEEDHPSVYGRFDLAFTDGVPKLLEFNADTPTMLLEAAVIQWQWLQAVRPDADQFNTLHEKLIAQWTMLKDGYYIDELVHFAHVDSVEDLMTVTYLRDTAEQAGLRTRPLLMHEIGWDGQVFHDPEQLRIATIFKLYPWEWMWREPYAEVLMKASTKWIEPAWRLLLSNKAILAILWELFPDHPYLLPAYLDAPKNLASWVSKPFFGREGENIEVNTPVKDLQFQMKTGGRYDAERRVFQQYSPLPTFPDSQGSWQALIGSWVIGGAAAGIGVREEAGFVTRNASPFVPHLFV